MVALDAPRSEPAVCPGDHDLSFESDLLYLHMRTNKTLPFSEGFKLSIVCLVPRPVPNP